MESIGIALLSLGTLILIGCLLVAAIEFIGRIR